MSHPSLNASSNPKGEPGAAGGGPEASVIKNMVNIYHSEMENMSFCILIELIEKLKLF